MTGSQSMPILWRAGLTLLLVALAPRLATAGQAAIVYPDCTEIEHNARFTVTVDGQPTPTYNAKIAVEERFHSRPYVNQTADVGYTIFSLREPAAVRIELTQAPDRVDILPRSLGITPTLDGKTISFELTKPAQIIVQLDGNINDHLYLFAMPPETDVPDPKAPNVTYFGPGLHDAGLIKPTDGQTIYLAGGAVVRGRFSISDCKEVTVRGRGILLADQSPDKANMILAGYSDDLVIEGITFIAAQGWCIRMQHCKGIDINWVNMIHWYQNSDGIDPCSTQDVLIEDVFIRNYDDGVVIKTFPDEKSVGRDVSSNITVRRCTVITDHANSFKLGANESTGRLYKDIRFEDCDTIMPRGVAIQVGIDGVSNVENIAFENIRVEGPLRMNKTAMPDNYTWPPPAVPGENRNLLVGLRPLISIRTNEKAKHPYIKEPYQAGSIYGVTLRNIVYTTPDPNDLPDVFIWGHDADSAVHDVVLDHVMVHGKAVTAAYPMLRINENVELQFMDTLSQ